MKSRLNVCLSVQVTRLQYLNALMASRATYSPDTPEIKILPNSQTKLLNERNTTQGMSANTHKHKQTLGDPFPINHIGPFLVF